MRRLFGFAMVLLPLAGCAPQVGAERPIMNFYHQAKQRQKKFDPSKTVSFDGLKVDFGVLPGSGGAGTIDQSSLVVTDPNPLETQAVQVIVDPRVSGSFLDPATPSPEFLAEQTKDIEEALRTHRYAAVYLLPKPIDEQAAGGNGGQAR